MRTLEIEIRDDGAPAEAGARESVGVDGSVTLQNSSPTGLPDRLTKILHVEEDQVLCLRPRDN